MSWVDRSKDPLADEHRERIVGRGDRWLDAYYYSFEPTGDPDIDLILGAVAWAGKWAHNTEGWTESMDYDNRDGWTPAEVIQAAANSAAARRAAPSQPEGNER